MDFNNLSYSLGLILAQAKPSTSQVESGFGYVIAAFVVVWLFIAGYLFWLNRRQENLRQEVMMLRQEEADRLQQPHEAVGANIEDTVSSSVVAGRAGPEESVTTRRPELGG